MHALPLYTGRVADPTGMPGIEHVLCNLDSEILHYAFMAAYTEY